MANWNWCGQMRPARLALMIPFTRKYCLLFVAASIAASVTLAQTAGPAAVSWTNTAAPVSAPGGERAYRLQFSGRIAPGYIVYGSDFQSALGPNPTRLRLDNKEGVTPRESLQSSGSRKGKDKAFDSDYTYFEGEARLSQLVTVAPGVTRITGTLRGQTCYEADGTCQLFSAPIDIALP